ncbi:stress response nst1, partial [Trichoderma arundinaceum]
MPAHHQKPAPLAPASPRNTAKYTNKDGSKFITVPKGSPSDSSRPSTPTVAKSNYAPPPSDLTGLDTSAPTVNRKKQKRRQKAAAKAAAAQAANGHPSPALSSDKQLSADYELVASDEDDDVEYDLADDVEPIPTTNGHTIDAKSNKKNKKKKKKNGVGANAEEVEPEQQHHHRHHHHHHHHYHEDGPAPTASISRGSGMSRDKIWSTSNHEERERIKEFWLGLGEDDRKSLVKVEKDAVLKKMKEQQKHTCSCTVCGRKRTAIEEELEGLYDAYYLELEQFANQGEGPPM